MRALCRLRNLLHNQLLPRYPPEMRQTFTAVSAVRDQLRGTREDQFST